MCLGGIHVDSHVLANVGNLVCCCHSFRGYWRLVNDRSWPVVLIQISRPKAAIGLSVTAPLQRR